MKLTDIKACTHEKKFPRGYLPVNPLKDCLAHHDENGHFHVVYQFEYFFTCEGANLLEEIKKLSKTKKLQVAGVFDFKEQTLRVFVKT